MFNTSLGKFSLQQLIKNWTNKQAIQSHCSICRLSHHCRDLRCVRLFFPINLAAAFWRKIHELLVFLLSISISSYLTRESSLVSAHQSNTLEFFCIENGPFPASFCFFRSFQRHILQKQTVGFGRIRTRIVGIEGKHSDHLTTTTAHFTLGSFHCHNIQLTTWADPVHLFSTK